jgi:hypothetical protein
LVALRWRCSQWLLAVTDRDDKQVVALHRAMQVEGMKRADILDELTLLRDQFGLRPRGKLLDEIDRQARRLGVAL